MTALVLSINFNADRNPLKAVGYAVRLGHPKIHLLAPSVLTVLHKKIVGNPKLGLELQIINRKFTMKKEKTTKHKSKLKK